LPNRYQYFLNESVSESKLSDEGEGEVSGKTTVETGATDAKANETDAAQENATEAQADIEADAEAIAAETLAGTGPNGSAEMASLPDFSGMLADVAASSIELLNDVELNVKIELGRSEMTVNEILRLSSGSVVELDKLAGDPVDVLVNEQLVARGEVLVVNDSFCVRINEIVPGISERVAGATTKVVR